MDYLHTECLIRQGTAGHTIKSWSFYESAISGSGSTHGKQGANGGSLFGGFFS